MNKKRKAEFRKNIMMIIFPELRKMSQHTISAQERAVPYSVVKRFQMEKERDLLNIIDFLADNHEQYFIGRSYNKRKKKRLLEPTKETTKFLINRQELLDKAKVLFDSLSKDEKTIAIYDIMIEKIPN